VVPHSLRFGAVLDLLRQYTVFSAQPVYCAIDPAERDITGLNWSEISCILKKLLLPQFGTT
jgi:hypothetical protein